MKTRVVQVRVVQVRIVSIPMSPKSVDTSVPVPKWLKTFGPSTKVSGDTSALMPNWSGHFGPKMLVPKWFDTEVYWYRSVRLPCSKQM